MMKTNHLVFIFIVLLLCIPAACSAVVIQPGADGDGYSWSSDGLIVTITGSSKEYTLSNAISDSIIVVVDADEVTLNGNNVPITGIAGNPTLDLENVYIDGGVNGGVFIRSKDKFYGISECRNIKNSSIAIEKRENDRGRNYPVSGIGELYGNLDDSTSITVTSFVAKSSGVYSVYGEISGGKFTVTSPPAKYYFPDATYGVVSVKDGGVISGGEFTITASYALGVNSVSGEISGGKFTVTSDMLSGGVNSVEGGVISGGEFIVICTSTVSPGYGHGSLGVVYVKNGGVISGGKFTLTGNDTFVDNLEGSGAEFTVISTVPAASKYNR